MAVARVTPAEFVAARLAEWETAAQAATRGGWVAITIYVDRAEVHRTWGRVNESWSLAAVHAAADAEHMAMHDPATVLAQVEAQRLILARYAYVEGEVEAATDRTHAAIAHAPSAIAANHTQADAMRGILVTLDLMVRTLAAQWPDHYDYQREWAR